MKQGNIQISSENMMPIIKKWLYSDKDIFLREIVANGVDAVTKFKKLVTMGEATEVDGQEYCIKISIDKDAKTLTVEDNGIGMTADEVEKYITQIAFSGANDFLVKYEKAGGDGIIGHFGLGFYSAYMVSEMVDIETKSYKDGEPAVKWSSDGNSTYTLDECDKSERGTKIVMHILDEESEFLSDERIKSLVKKYCSFMPYNIYFDYKGDGKDVALNTVSPLYLKSAKDCTDEEYKNFYTDTFMDYEPPIFWVHLDMDYPFKLKGILYFPKVKNKVELERGKVKLYCNQVFIADNIKEVIPEFLMLLNGVIDCPDIPLNVSRSFLQNDKQVQRITKYIIRKVSDKLNELYKQDKTKYEECWADIANFIKYGCIKENDFYDKVKDIIIWKDIYGEYKTLNDFLPQKQESEEVKDDKSTKEPTKIYYVSDEHLQAQYVKLFKDAGLNAICSDTFIDPHFISFIEYKMPSEVKFMRIDADVAGALKGDEETEDSVLCDIFKNAINDEHVTIKCQSLKNTEVPAVINVDEYMRRYSEMGQFYGMTDDKMSLTIMVNTSNPVVAAIKDLSDDKQTFVAKYIYSLALLSFKKLTPDELQNFIEGNVELLKNYVNSL